MKYPYRSTIQCVLRQVSSVSTVVQTVKIPSGTTCDVLVSSDRSLRGQLGVIEPNMVYLSSIGLESVDTLVCNMSWNVIPISNPGLETDLFE